MLSIEIFIPCATLSTESSKQRLTFLLDRQFFASLAFDLIFMICPKKLVRFRFGLTSFFRSFEVKIFLVNLCVLVLFLTDFS